MLFFKDIKEDKLADPEFKSVYDRECHICGTTMDVVGACLSKGEGLAELLASLDIDAQAFRDLRDGEFCDPRLVEKLYRHLGIEGTWSLDNCPRAACVPDKGGES